VRHAVDYGKRYPNQEFVGLSINASGDAEPVRMESVLNDSSLPQGCKPKLAQAVEMGIDELRMVRKISEATSVDLVTEPGAKGKIISYLENNKMAKKKNPFIESKDEQKLPVMEAKEKEKEAEPEGAADHADVAQDKALILDMIKKYMAGEGGEEIELDEAASSAAHEAYEAYKEMGKGHDEAMKCAADALALAKHVAKKKDEEKSEEACDADADVVVEEKAEQKESHVAKLEGRIAFLERALKEKELAETLDRKLAESGLGRRETDVLRKLIGKPKSEAVIAEKIETFKEGFGMAQKAGGESAPKKSPFVFTSEKTGEKAQSTGKVDFAAFLKK
jgi:hypothetical protein